MPLIGSVDPDCKCGRGHNRFGWFWSEEMQRVHDLYEGVASADDRAVPPMLPVPPTPTLEESVLELKQQFENRMRNK